MSLFMIGAAVAAVLLTFVVCFIVIPSMFRTVVDTNMVHIVQSSKKTTSYGTGQPDGNVYYEWPSWIPVIGITKIALPVSNFDLSLHGYKAYDKERVPFELDVTAFFRISDTNKAAERVATIEALKKQLEYVVQGAVRKILASHDINQIMVDRATFGEQFTQEVKGELANWGVEPVKNMELMDIRDSDTSKVITAIMAKKTSHIEMESRTEVARNNQAAEMAEIEARQKVQVRQQESEQAVGSRTADKEKAVGIAKQQALQEIKVEEAKTKEREMEVTRVAQVQQAEIDKASSLVTAAREKEVAILAAEGQLEATRRHAEGVKADGEAKALAEQLMQMAPVQAQIALAKEIGSNEGYQSYLVALETVKSYITVGTEQAKALAAAEVKVIVNAGSTAGGVTEAMQLFSSKGGLAIGSMLEALKQTEQGSQLLEGVARALPNSSKKNGATGISG
jgi:flotillin